MTKVKQIVPLLPAVDIKATIHFFEDLGFQNIYKKQPRSGSYAVMRNDYLKFHLYTYKKLEIPTPTNMYLFEIENIDEFHQHLETTYQENVGKKPSRSGLPRMGTPKSLNFDRRFSLTDPNGNHFIFVEPYPQKADHKIQTKFERIYWESNTLAYSHESPLEAAKMMQAGISRYNLADEQPQFVFQAYVLLVDCFVLLGKTASAQVFYLQAQKFQPQSRNIDDKYLQDALEQFQKYEYLGY